MARRSRKRKKNSGIIYFATNNRIPNMVKIGMTIDTAEARLRSANRKHEFMCGRWSITHKVRTNNVQRTEDLSHKIFREFHDDESVSSEMYFIPEGMSIKRMADIVRNKDRVLVEQIKKQNAAKAELDRVQAELDAVLKETEAMIAINDEEDSIK